MLASKHLQHKTNVYPTYPQHSESRFDSYRGSLKKSRGIARPYGLQRQPRARVLGCCRIWRCSKRICDDCQGGVAGTFPRGALRG